MQRIIVGHIIIHSVFLGTIITGCKSDTSKTIPEKKIEKKAEVLENWEYEHFVSLNCKGDTLKEVAKEIERRTGREVTVDRFHDDYDDVASRKITLNLHKVPFWEAIAEVSKASRAGFSVGGNGVEFSTNEPVFKEYRLVGPLLIGLTSEMQDADGPSPKTTARKVTRLRVLKFPEYAVILNPPKISFSNPEGNCVGALFAPYEGEIGLYEADFLYSLPFSDEGMNIRGHFRTRLVCNPKPVVIPVLEGHSVDVRGLHVSVTKIAKSGDKTKIEYKITWDHGFTDMDINRLDKVQLDLDKDWQWLCSLSGRTKSYEITKARFLKGNGKEPGRPNESSISSELHDISGSYTFVGDPSNMVIHMKVGRVIFADVEFSFGD